LIETPITGAEAATEETRFAAAIAGFGQLAAGVGLPGRLGLGPGHRAGRVLRGDDPFGYRVEAVNLMRLAQGLAAN
jgi:Ca-activated chloride channel homolog